MLFCVSTMLKTFLSYFKSFLQAAVIFLLISTVLDWWRKPVQTAPDFPLVAISGQTQTVQQFSKDRVSIVYFWANWCSICRYTSPAINKLHQNGTPVLSIAVQSGQDSDIASYLKEHDFSFPAANDSDGMLAKQWQVFAFPTILFVKDGQIVHHTTGISSYFGLRSRLAALELFH